MLAYSLEEQAQIETRPLRATSVPRPETGRGEIRIRVTACGVCRADLHVIEGDSPGRRLRRGFGGARGWRHSYSVQGHPVFCWPAIPL